MKRLSNREIHWHPGDRRHPDSATSFIVLKTRASRTTAANGLEALKNPQRTSAHGFVRICCPIWTVLSCKTIRPLLIENLTSYDHRKDQEGDRFGDSKSGAMILDQTFSFPSMADSSRLAVIQDQQIYSTHHTGDPARLSTGALSRKETEQSERATL